MGFTVICRHILGFGRHIFVKFTVFCRHIFGGWKSWQACFTFLHPCSLVWDIISIKVHIPDRPGLSSNSYYCYQGTESQLTSKDYNIWAYDHSFNWCGLIMFYCESMLLDVHAIIWSLWLTKIYQEKFSSLNW